MLKTMLVEAARRFLQQLNQDDRRAIGFDIDCCARGGEVDRKAIKGRRPMFEIRTGGFRTFCFVKDGALNVLAVCAKQHQDQIIPVAHQRMRELGG